MLAEDPCIVQLANSRLIMNPGGGPTPDKPDVTIVAREAGHTVSSFLNLGVADIAASYVTWQARGAEIRCSMRDPDGYLIEVGQSIGLLAQ